MEWHRFRDRKEFNKIGECTRLVKLTLYSEGMLTESSAETFRGPDG